ncbi:N-acetylglucosamine kinase [Aureimonas sp. SA4125]|uniref:BadF/BadG/BcrA/BcrD ATPase family protein n=1 Tax=Aureimonas sp. SA4125 TaxID=2826993 RepID=UPI001CC467DA|nr:BadF/BadG/BcrA/BcrD ATPase family protein [Aureimonas sp. SA4125]BDA86187.1 N-acetylglucosamine kinase [Aureimonas sp. SA4125]
MQQPILIGVDGGGSRCRARARLADGTPIGEAEGGSANIFSDLDLALVNILAVTRAALEQGGHGEDDLARCHVGLGLAGANIPSLAAELGRRELPFAARAIETDAVVACRGAHADQDGAIAILGTGTAYVRRSGATFASIGGWGFALSDQGGGGYLGRAALVAALLAHDGIGPASDLTRLVLDRFDGDAARLVEFGGEARPVDFGGFAPLVMDNADAGDPVAIAIVREGVFHIVAALTRLLALGAPSVVLLGGLAARYRSHLPDTLMPHIAEAKGDALDGALALAATLVDAAER